jgi:hypothetical protein
MEDKTELQIAWEKFIMTIAENLGIIKLLNWTISKMNKL